MFSRQSRYFILLEKKIYQHQIFMVVKFFFVILFETKEEEKKDIL
jgi:hypothetical protein